jgi:hypothetical protein
MNRRVPNLLRSNLGIVNKLTLSIFSHPHLRSHLSHHAVAARPPTCAAAATARPLACATARPLALPCHRPLARATACPRHRPPALPSRCPPTSSTIVRGPRPSRTAPWEDLAEAVAPEPPCLPESLRRSPRRASPRAEPPCLAGAAASPRL